MPSIDWAHPTALRGLHRRPVYGGEWLAACMVTYQSPSPENSHKKQQVPLAPPGAPETVNFPLTLEKITESKLRQKDPRRLACLKPNPCRPRPCCWPCLASPAR